LRRLLAAVRGQSDPERAKMRRRRNSTDAAAARCRMRPKSGRYKLCATVALPTHFHRRTTEKVQRIRRAKKLMKTHAVLAVVLLMLGLAPATATVRIANDTGGQIGPYLAKYRALRASGERVEIDGTCASACTMLLGIIPRNRICVTPRATLVFHSAWDMEGDQAVTSDGNRILWSTYPESVRRWIKSHGGLHSQTITLSGPELAAMFPACR